jgi:transcriptional regulator with XRE-family HTH domain
MKMGDRMRELRKERGITQEELGHLIGVQKSAVRKYEKGTIKSVKQDAILKMSTFFNVNPCYLMGMSDDRNLARPFKGDCAEQIRAAYGDGAITLLHRFSQLNLSGKNTLIDRAGELCQLPQYTEKGNSLLSENSAA